MARDFNVKVDFSDVLALAGRLADISDEAIGRATVTALNETTDATFELSRERMLKNINLSDDYVKRKMRVKHATVGRPEAEIVAFGGRSNLTPLGRYDARPVLQPAKAGRAGPTRVPGVPSGSKQAGVVVQVLKSQANSDFVPRGFLLPLRRGREAGGNGVGVFARNRKGELIHRYGPSVYQLFAFQAPRIEDEAAEALENELVANVNELLRKAAG